ncbi:von Willebrand factor type A [Lasiodiplodia theobromae]|nr:von Willebrand factor type A [Lasiodiplodia theobromae]
MATMCKEIIGMLINDSCLCVCSPSRFEAQEDAVNLIFSAKIQSNPESSVGLMSMGATGPEVLTTLTTDMGKILDGLHRTKIRGSPHFSTGINIAALALKHRQNKSQRQRIIVFTCSALPEDEKSLVKLAKRMKKNNINVDIIAFGDLAPENVKKLEAFNENVKGGDGSHLAIIPPSSNLLSDAIVTTPIIGGEAAPGGGAGGAGAQGGEGGGQEWEFGVDPSMDPELALALRMSYEEEKARQERERKAQESKEGKSELEGIAEEGGDESKPLLDKSGEPSGSGSGSKDSSDKKDKDDGDKMDTA